MQTQTSINKIHNLTKSLKHIFRSSPRWQKVMDKIKAHQSSLDMLCSRQGYLKDARSPEWKRRESFRALFPHQPE